MSQTDDRNGSRRGRRKNSWDRFRRDDQRRRRLFLEQLERRDLMAIAEMTALPDQYYLAAPNADSVLTAPQTGDAASLAISYLRDNASSFGLTSGDLNHYDVTNSYTSQQGSITHVYLRQIYNGLPIANAVASVSMMPGGRVLTAAASFVPGLVEPPASAKPTPYITAEQALRTVAGAHGIATVFGVTTAAPSTGRNMRTVLRAPDISRSDIIAELHYVPKETGGVQLAWKVNVDMIEGFNWYDASVSAEFAPGAPIAQLVNVSDWVDNATYNVFAYPVESPLHGTRSIAVDPQDPVTSPFGWHDTNGAAGAEFTVTRGNNVSAQEDADNNNTGGVQPDGGAGLNFNFPLDTTQAATTYTSAATVNLFYWNNIVHDVTARHGFDEVSGNFQATNYTGAGLGNDPVQADSQDGSGTNNANFATPPDGQSGRMQQYIFDVTTPTRDSSLDSSIIVHEFGHGVSNRLTGGPANVNALNALQSGGMGEGWSDWLGLMLTQKPGDQANDARGLGMWVLGQPITGVGVRRVPYSFDMAINPSTLGDFNQSNEVHDAGEAWCSALWDMNWLMINRHGYDPDLYTGGGGNNLALDIVLLGMKLQPANPTFCQARDAILAADAALTGSDNFVEIWTAFARRGFGLSADCGIDADSTTVVEAFDQPDPPVTVGGIVFNDENGNGLRGPGELPLAGWTVYVDSNNNGVRDQSERFAVSAADGSYRFRLFVSGNLTIREEVQQFWRQTFPGGDGAHRINIFPGQSLNNLHFGNRELSGEIHGRKWNDLNGNAILDTGEPGIQGIVIYVDINNDRKIAIGEPAAVTDKQGNYTIKNVRPGLYTVREVMQPGLVQTFPDPADPVFGAHYDVRVNRGQVTPGINFGNQAAFDYGDAPGPYPTLISQNGAVHGILQGFVLGKTVDAEANGQPSVNADGDDFAGNEVQNVSLPAATTGGTFTLTFSGQTTEPISWNADAAAVQAALEALPSLGAGQVSVTGGPGPAPWAVTFTGTLANKDVAPMTGNGSQLTPPGSVTITQQRSGGIDDEDGVVLGNLRPGQTGSVAVTVATSTFASGYLQGWIDFNRDGDWNDSGEQIFVDRQLTTGTYPSLAFDVPSTASLGRTYARFRFSLQLGIGPTGSALGGEVEDYVLNLLATTPTAIDDEFTVNSDSLLSQNQLDVLANDLPSATGPAGIDPAGFDTTSEAGGLVDRFDPNTPQTPNDFTDDVLRYQPPSGFVGVDTFEYRVRDANGNVSAPATVTINVQFVPRDPIAVDNTFDVEVNSINNPLDVLSNDIQGTGGALTLLPPPATTANGTVTLGNGVYLYTPNTGFSGSDSFTYTVQDAQGKLATGNVWIQVHSPITAPEADDIIQFELRLFNQAGQLLQNGSMITVGETITVRGFADDLRGPVIDPVSNQDFSGAQSAYMDLLYERLHVQSTGTFGFGPKYQFAKSADGSIPGLTNEIGAANADLTNSPGPNPVEVFHIVFRATRAGEVQFIADPADVSPDHDITAYFNDPNPLLSGIRKVDLDEVFFKASPTITVIGSGEGEDTNLLVPLDVNEDGFISPLDALLIVNYLNEDALPSGGASGEGTSNKKLDVTADGHISALDALKVINYLNALKSSGGGAEGEGEGESDDGGPSLRFSPAVLSGAESPTLQTTLADSVVSDLPTVSFASSVDQVFAYSGQTSSATSRGEESLYSSSAASADEFFAELGTSVARRARKKS